MSSSIRFINGKLVLPNGTLQEGIINVQNGRITSIELSTSSSLSNTSTSNSTIIDIQGNIIAPGYIDLQWNGGYGIDLSDTDLTEDNVLIALKKLLSTGVTSINPTIISSPKKIYERNIPIVGRIAI